MKKIILCNICMLVGFLSFGQEGLPANPEAGKCYVRCVTPDVYKNVDETILVKPEHKVLKVVQATFKEVEERVVVKEASKRYEVVNPKWTKETITLDPEDGVEKLSVVPAKFRKSSSSFESKPAYAKWVLGEISPECQSPNPDDCKVWCYKGFPAEYSSVDAEEMISDASVNKESISLKSTSYVKQVISQESSVKEIEIPAEYKVIKKTVVDTPARIDEQVIPAVYKTVSKEVMETKGGLTTWKEVDCELTEYNMLPINWRLGSAVLTNEAMSIIDRVLIPIIKENDGTSIEIASHTDSRGTKESNRALSERRAAAVVAYLETKGVNTSRLVPNGYGESQLLNRCADSVSCTEREHRENRRTQFRIISK